jgi:hypothetical protein
MILAFMPDLEPRPLTAAEVRVDDDHWLILNHGRVYASVLRAPLRARLALTVAHVRQSSVRRMGCRRRAVWVPRHLD